MTDFLTGGYWFEDVNLNNEIRYLGGSNDRAYILDNIYALTGNPQTNAYYTSVIPGAFTGKDAELNEGPFDITLSETGTTVSAEIITNDPVVNGIVDNIQLTLSWKTADTDIAQLLTSFTSGFMLTPQGEPVEVNGVMHQVFVSVTPVSLPEIFNEGDVLPVLSFVKDPGQTVTGRLWIADDEYTAENNAMYYVSVWGSDFTGVIQNLATGIKDLPVNNSVNIYPNPVRSGSVNIAMNLDKSQKLIITVTNIEGRVITTNEIYREAGLTIAPFDLNSFSRGVYIIRISGESLTSLQKLIVE